MSLLKVVGSIIVLAASVAFFLSFSGANREPDCDSPLALESLNLKVRCISVIDDDLSFPRNLLSLNGELWLIDKGTDLFTTGYNEGTLYRYQPTENGYKRQIILDELLDPNDIAHSCLLYTSPSPRDLSTSRMPSSA